MGFDCLQSMQGLSDKIVPRSPELSLFACWETGSCLVSEGIRVTEIFYVQRDLILT